MRPKNTSFHLVSNYQPKKLRLPSVHQKNLSVTKSNIQSNNENSIMRPKISTPSSKLKFIGDIDEKRIKSHTYENTNEVVFNALLMNLLKKVDF
jgi:hypothetical protein